MKRYIKFLLTGLIAPLLVVSCTGSYMGIEQVVTDTTPPDKISVNEVVSKPGALEVHFTLPQGNPDITQVVASYINNRGDKMEFKVSRYTSSILVEGFTGTDEKTVELVCIDASGNESEVVSVKAAPLISPVELAFKTMIAEPTFGGVRVDWQNEDAQPFIIHVLTEDVLQVGVVSLVEDPSKAIYNRDSVNTFAYVRQYPPIQQQFGFTISDKWGNRTDTLLRSLTPYLEELIDRTRITAPTFFNPTYFSGSRDYDQWAINPATGIQNDGNYHGAAGQQYNPITIFNGTKTTNELYVYKFVKNLSDPDPANRIQVQDVYSTYDLNRHVRLNRIHVFPRTGSNQNYTNGSVKRFRIWGTNDANSERWTKFPETWTLIGEFVGPEPADRNNLTPEEIEWFQQNQEFLISDDNVNPDAHPTESFRYMRIQWMETYFAGANMYTMNELEMYGEYVN